jgi:hypothetical protein
VSRVMGAGGDAARDATRLRAGESALWGAQRAVSGCPRRMWKAGILLPLSVSSHMLTSCLRYVGGGGQKAIWLTVDDAMLPAHADPAAAGRFNYSEAGRTRRGGGGGEPDGGQ